MEKIVITREMLLTEIIDRLTIVKRSRILLFLEDGSDIGTSVVTLKLILEKAKELQKKIIFITTDVISQKVITSSGILFYPQEQQVKEEDWLDTIEKKNNNIKNDTVDNDTFNNVDDSVLENNINDANEKSSVLNSCDVFAPVGVSKPEIPEKQGEIRSVGGFSMVVGGDINNTSLSTPVENVTIEPTVSQPLPNSTVNFEKKASMNVDKKLIGMDWGKGSVNLKESEINPVEKKDIYVRKGGIKEKFMNNEGVWRKIFKQKFVWLGLGLGIVIGAVWFFYYYNFVPKVEVTLYPENIPVSYVGTVIAKDTAIGISINEGVATISSKTGERISTLSESGNTEQKTEVGDSAKGSVTLYNATTAEIVLSAGTVLVGGGKNFKLVDGATVPAQVGESNGTKIVSVTANEIGPEYNLSAGTFFSVTGFEPSSLYGQNYAAFTGGKKEEIYVVSEADVLRIGEQLEKNLEEQLKQQLRDLYPADKWALVEDQITIEKGTGVERFQTDVPIGSEATIVNVTVELKASAVYYNVDELEAAVKELLILDYNSNITENENGSIVDATLDNKFGINIKTISVKDNVVNIEIDASGVMRTSIDTVKTSQELKGKKWDEGIEYLNNLPSMRQEPLVVLTPENYSKKFRHFPNNTSRITVRIKNESVE
ncbi:MAG TPA: hypothetical protein PLL26_01555 [Candidatus Dojkabacteria bacterium]|nr:hypothetical protein [Candidatus Dojkabacteria bacterium]